MSLREKEELREKLRLEKQKLLDKFNADVMKIDEQVSNVVKDERLKKITSASNLGSIIYPIVFYAPSDDYNINPPSNYRPAHVAKAGYSERKLEIPFEEQIALTRADANYFSSLENGLEYMMRIEDEEIKKFGDFRKSSQYLPCVFLMNVVFSGTRIFLYWKLKNATPPIQLDKHYANQQLVMEPNILRELFLSFEKADLNVFEPKPGSNFMIAFDRSKTRFLECGDDWVIKILNARKWQPHLKPFVEKLKLRVFNTKNQTALKGNFSITGEYIYISSEFENDVPEMVRIMLHEESHTFPRSAELAEMGERAGRDAALSLSSFKHRGLRYEGQPMDCGTVFDYVFSDLPMPAYISPFSLNLKKYFMI